MRSLISLSYPINIDNLSVIKKHLWSEFDYKTWNERTCDNNFAVHITFMRSEEKSPIIKVNPFF